ncbi:hypothetical protein EJD97_003165 [Solanum chilense]|uniref:Putative plant transposon protein domain-containing protein n=1 Tax=Solanum chilense TaxID=4083 RepID=A0A6N2AN63_SOLCI|nr:hypothetical protein EJD97_003165 [Solanum chilense]
METTTTTITSTGVTMVIKKYRNGSYVPPQNREVTPRDCGGSLARVEDMLHKIMRRFDASDEHNKELRNDLAGQPGTLPSNTVQNPKNDGHFMAITTRGGKQTIDQPMPTNEKKVTKDTDTHIDPLQVLSTMALKQDRVYSRGRSKFVAPSARLVIGSDDKRDPEYVPPGTSIPSRTARAPRATPKKEALGVVTSSQSDEERTLTGTPYGSATNEEGVYGSLGVPWSEEASGSAEVPAPPLQRRPRLMRLTVQNPHPVHQLVLSPRAPLEQVRVRGILVDISLPSIRQFLYSENVDDNRTPLTAEFYYRWQIVKDVQFMRDPSLRDTTKRWMDLHLSVDGEGADWVTEPKGTIKKANLTFTAKFLWLIVRHCLSPTAAEYMVTWDRAVPMANDSRVRGGFCVASTDGVPIWNVDQLKTPLGTVDIGLIRDEANELDPRRGPRPELPPLGDNLADTVAQALTATQAAYTDTTPVESIPGSSTAPSSSRSASLPVLVPLARVQKLEAQMATLLHHIQPWMQSSITEAEERLEQRMAAVDRLRADIDMILEASVLESEAPSVDPAEDIVMAALLNTSEIPPPPPREHAKRRRGREEDEA